jgi:hypothetical protein
MHSRHSPRGCGPAVGGLLGSALGPLSRRSALGLLATAPWLLSRRAEAFGASSLQDIAELQLSRGTLSRPAAWARLLYELMEATSVEANPSSVLISPEDPQLFEHPFAVLIGEGALPPQSAAAIEQLRRYLSYGGFLVFDDASGSPDSAFAKSVRSLCSTLFPTRPMAPLPGDHSVFRAFFLLDAPVGRTARSSVLEGVTIGPITPIMYVANDLSGALDRGPDGRPKHAAVPGGEDQRREALKLGINLLMYALTSNYKHDQAHVAELLREGKLLDLRLPSAVRP